jgi:hypothetical protein
MKSLLFQDAGLPFVVPAECSALTKRKEVPVNIKKNGRIYRFVLRDKIAPEDPYLILVRAAAFAIQTGEAYNGTPPSRAIRDFLIKTNVGII